MESILIYALAIGVFFVPWKRYPRAKFVFWGIYGIAILVLARST